MSTNFAEEFAERVPLISDPLEESWEEALRPLRHRPHGEGLLIHGLHIGEEPKKYRLVYNREAGALRLEAQQAQAVIAASSAVERALGDRITEVIEASRRILALEDNWDEEGSPGYAEGTWLRATNFIKEAVINYQRISGQWAVPPRILPGPEGSIDIHWRTPNREVLINVPPDEEAPAGYYGSGSPNDTIKGKLDPSAQNSWLLVWLLR